MSQDIGRLISQYDQEFTTERLEGASNFERFPSIETLNDGVYTFIIREATTDVIKDTPVVRLHLLHQGEVYEHLYWLNNQTAVNMLGQALVCLRCLKPDFRGKFSSVIGQCVGHLAGVRATAKKGTKQGEKKDFVTFYWQSYIGRVDIATAAPQAVPTYKSRTGSTRFPDAVRTPFDSPPGYDAGASNEDDIPF